jgi:DNA primase
VAAGGSSLTPGQARLLKNLNPSKYILCFDPDDAGIEGAIKAQKKLSHYLPKETTIRVFTLDVEPKECTKESLESYLSKGIQYGL